ncbi:MAG: hypothetical protein Q9165_000277 [Trypethelium subeluteriae]
MTRDFDIRDENEALSNRSFDRNFEMESDDDEPASTSTMSTPPSFASASASRSRKRSLVTRSQPRQIRTPSSPMASTIPGNLLPSAPASPPTPAPSPTPTQRAPDWSTAAEHEDQHVRDIRTRFADMNDAEKQRLLAELLNMCSSHQLAFVHDFVSPRLKKDPFTTLPTELCLRILTFIDDPTTLARSSQVSKRWRELVSDDMAWKSLCEKHAYRRLSNEESQSTPPQVTTTIPTPTTTTTITTQQMEDSSLAQSTKFSSFKHIPPNPLALPTVVQAPDLLRTRSVDRAVPVRHRRRPKAMSYRSHFKQRYQVETAWRSGGHVIPRQIQPDQGVVTSLHLTDRYIVVALDNAKIHVFDTEGQHQRTLQGHVMGVWAMVPWGDTLVSGGCDRDVRVWNMASGKCLAILQGHTSLVGQLQMRHDTLVTGGSDGSVRVWSLQHYQPIHRLAAHDNSVTSLQFDDARIVSGGSDGRVKVWDLKRGTLVRELSQPADAVWRVVFEEEKAVIMASRAQKTVMEVWSFAPPPTTSPTDFYSDVPPPLASVSSLPGSTTNSSFHHPSRSVHSPQPPRPYSTSMLQAPSSSSRSGSPVSMPDHTTADYEETRQTVTKEDVEMLDAFAIEQSMRNGLGGGSVAESSAQGARRNL